MVDHALASRADVYLAMWKAIESFDPNHDRWSEPTDFGSQHERIESAENAIQAMESRYPDCIDEALRDDVQRFRDTITGFRSKEMVFTKCVAEFCDHLGDIGTKLAYESLKQADSAARQH